MSDLKPVTMYCCKGCQHLHHEIVTACDCGTGCEPFEYELWEARRTQPEATAPAQCCGWEGHCGKCPFPFPSPESPVQDLSAAILPKPVHFTEKGAPLYTQGQLEDCIKNAGGNHD